LVKAQDGAMQKEREKTARKAHTPAEFAAVFGRHPSWAYRLLYAQKINAVTDFGRILIPASEVQRVLGSAKPYNPLDHPSKDDEATEHQAAERELAHA
jgi:hypothetical protein